MIKFVPVVEWAPSASESRVAAATPSTHVWTTLLSEGFLSRIRALSARSRKNKVPSVSENMLGIRVARWSRTQDTPGTKRHPRQLKEPYRLLVVLSRALIPDPFHPTW